MKIDITLYDKIQSLYKKPSPLHIFRPVKITLIFIASTHSNMAATAECEGRQIVALLVAF